MANIPFDGRIPSLSTLTTTLVGSEMMYIVSPGNNAYGNSYNITLNYLAGFFSSFPQLNSALVTSGSAYQVQSTDTRVLIDKTIGSATSVVFPAASTLKYGQSVLVKDLKGDAATNPITITFSGGQLCDAEATIIINNPYGWVYITPLPSVSGTSTGFYMS